MTLGQRGDASCALVLDYDDTLAAAGSALDAPTSASLKRLRGRYLMILATQRAGWSLPALVEENEFDWVISDGGARVRREGRDVGLVPIPEADLAHILDATDRPPIAVNTLDGLVYEASYPVSSPHAQAIETGRIQVGEYPVLALFLAVMERPHALPKEVGSRVVVGPSNWPGVLVVRQRAASKINQVRRILSEAGIERERTTSFGNSPSDDDLLRWTGRAYVVGPLPSWHASHVTDVQFLVDHRETRAALDEIYRA